MKYLCQIAMITLISASLTTVANNASSKPLRNPEKGFIAKTIKVNDKSIKYIIYVPADYKSSIPRPAIVFLNGRGECGTDGFKQISTGLGPAITANVSAWPFIVIFPQKQDYDTLWEDEDSMVMSILDKSIADYNIDKSRLYLTGLSQGGHGTWAIAAEHPDMFAAIAPICGWGDSSIAAKVSKIPSWIFHGDADEAVHVDRSREMERDIKAAGGSCKLTIYPGVGHNSWDRAYRDEDLGEWFLQHSKKSDSIKDE